MKRKRELRGAAMVEMALCLAVFTPILFGGLRLAYGASQMHDLADAASDAARAGGACASKEEIRRIVMDQLPDVAPSDIVIAMDRTSQPTLIRVSIENYRVARLASSQPLPQAPSATFPYACD
jgi:Flp pilus assembly protein TadG